MVARVHTSPLKAGRGGLLPTARVPPLSPNTTEWCASLLQSREALSEKMSCSRRLSSCPGGQLPQLAANYTRPTTQLPDHPKWRTLTSCAMNISGFECFIEQKGSSVQDRKGKSVPKVFLESKIVQGVGILTDLQICIRLPPYRSLYSF